MPLLSSTIEGLIERGVRTMRAQYAESLQGMYRERPRFACGLIEHVTDRHSSTEQQREVIQRSE